MTGVPIRGRGASNNLHHRFGRIRIDGGQRQKDVPASYPLSVHIDLLAQCFRLAIRRIGLNRRREEESLDCSAFNPPGRQVPLF